MQEKKKRKQSGSKIPHPSPHNFSYASSLTRLATQIQFRDPSPSDFWRSYASLSIHGRNNLRFKFDWTFRGFSSIRNFILIDRSSKTWLQSISVTSIYCTPENSSKCKKKKRNIQANTTSVTPPLIIVLFASLKLKLNLFISYFNLIFRRFPLFSSKKPQWNRTTLTAPPPPPPHAYPQG